MHGKGVIYFKNKTIKYEGYFINNNFEGKGKYYFENEMYYEGDWLKGLRHGKGKIVYKNRIIYRVIL